MKITPLAGESFGTRSVCTFVETSNVKVLIDPGVSLAPNRFGKPPHPIELEREAEHLKQIAKHAKKADALSLSHYHYDHYNPPSPEIWKGKISFVKHPTENINKSQMQRASAFLPTIEPIAKSLAYADGTSATFGKTHLLFSPAFPHGQDAKLGSVVMLAISDGKEKFLHASDVEGPPLKEQTDWIIQQDPNVLYIDGPMCWMAYRYPPELTRQSEKNLIRILEKTRVEKIILEHHFLREMKYKDRIPEAYSAAKKLGKEILTAAEFLGKENDFLEARRGELFKEHPVDISSIHYEKGD